MSGTPKLTRLLPPNAMRRPPKENSTQATCVRLTTLFSRAPKADCPTQAPSAHFFRASRFFGGFIPARWNLAQIWAKYSRKIDHKVWGYFSVRVKKIVCMQLLVTRSVPTTVVPVFVTKFLQLHDVIGASEF